MTRTWTLAEAVLLCTRMEAVCVEHGFHVALTGGVLYKDGPRKDLDVLFYRIRERRGDASAAGLMKALETLGLTDFVDHGFVTKATYEGRAVDILQPEAADGDYENRERRLSGFDPTVTW